MKSSSVYMAPEVILLGMSRKQFLHASGNMALRQPARHISHVEPVLFVIFDRCVGRSVILQVEEADADQKRPAVRAIVGVDLLTGRDALCQDGAVIQPCGRRVEIQLARDRIGERLVGELRAASRHVCIQCTINAVLGAAYHMQVANRSAVTESVCGGVVDFVLSAAVWDDSALAQTD